MSTLAGDFWVCGDCRSINNAGARQCYNCRTPRDRAAVDPSAIDPSTHGRLREIELPPFTSSRWAAMLATVLILAVAVLQVVQFNLVASLLDQIRRGVDATAEQLLYVGSIGILSFGAALLALIAWSLWLSRTVTSMPALGLGYPAANGLMAFIENFLPGLNLYRVPAIVRDVVRRLEPNERPGETMTRGEALIFAAWISLLGGFLVPRLLGFLTDDVRTLISISGIGTGLVVIGAIFLVVLIWWIEGRILKRREAQLAAMAGAPVASESSPVPTETAPATTSPPPEPDVVATRSAFAAATDAPDASASSFRLPGTEAPPSPAMEAAASAPPEPRQIPEPVIGPPAEASPPMAAPPADVFEPPPPVITPTVEPPPPATADTLAPAGPTPTPAAPSPAPGATPDMQPPPAVAELPAAAAGPPNLMIRISSRGMMTAELEGEVEHVMLDDLGPYAEALSHVGGTATIVIPSDDGMAGLIAKRAQRILEDTGVTVTIA